MEALRCIIVEDETSAAQKLESFIDRIEHLQLLHSFNDVTKAYNWLSQNTIDLIFLDLHLGELSGFDLLKNLTYTPAVIITTAFSEHAVQSYLYHINAYLLKPFSFADFMQALTKIPERSKLSSVKKDFVFIKTEHRLEKVAICDILYLEGMKDYIKVVLRDKELMTLMSFKDILDLLDNPDFCRVHHSFVVAIDKIEYIEKNRIVIKNQFIPISESRRQAFFSQLNK